MDRRKNLWWLGLALLVLLGTTSCSGILQELTREDGQVDRIRVSGGEGWKSWDRNSTKGDETAVFLRKESTF